MHRKNSNGSKQGHNELASLVRSVLLTILTLLMHHSAKHFYASFIESRAVRTGLARRGVGNHYTLSAAPKLEVIKVASFGWQANSRAVSI
ncbi:MAG: hypothetical protein ACJAQS_001277 [Porticoccus sp.]